MKPRYRILGRRNRQLIREIARKALRIHGADAKDRVSDMVRQKFTGWQILLVKIAIQLAFALIEYWLNNRTGPPPEEFVAGEPGAERPPRRGGRSQ